MPYASRHRLTGTLRRTLLASTLAATSLMTVATLPVWAAVPMDGYADLVEKVTPSVVFIEVTAKANPVLAQANPPPLDEFMKRFGAPDQGPNPEQQPDGEVMHGLGSGFIISADGEVVTNNHVVEGATDIKVRLEDGREFAAHVVGTDPMTDVALIKLDNASDLPVATLGTADHLRVGDAVVAVGNPFGLGGTVTSGIVSALDRDIHSGPYDSFIQTDAAINKGNSGGPLFNTGGDVVGMNTAIFSPSGGSVGIGFSVPVQTISDVVTQLRDHGHVDRGWLGVLIQPVTADLAEALGLATPDGAIVASVQPDSPAAAANLQSGDVILSVNGVAVDKTHPLPVMVASVASGETAKLAILREGKPETVSVTIGTLTPEKFGLASAPAETGEALVAPLGLTVQTLTPDMAQGLGLPANTTGLVIAKIEPDSANADRLIPGDVITEAAGQPVTSVEALRTAVAGATSKSAVLLKVMRQGAPMYLGAAIATL
jgi:serine protease Do